MASVLRSTAYRVAVTYSAAFTLAIVLLGVGVFLAIRVALQEQLDSRIHATLEDLRDAFHSQGLQGLEEEITSREASARPGDLAFAVFDAGGARIAGHLETKPPAPGFGDIVFRDPEEGDDVARAETLQMAPGVLLVVAADREPIEAIEGTIVSYMLIALASVAAIGLGGGLLLGRTLRRRLGAISDAAQVIMTGDLTRRMSISPRGDEFDRLGVTLNSMLDRIAALLENLQQVSRDIAHDLRTPLMKLRTRIEAMAARAGSPVEAEAREALARADDVLALFSAILRISEIESGRLKRTFTVIDLSELVRELCESYAPAIEDGGRSLTWNVAGGVRMAGDRECLALALVNILDNAQDHTGAGTAVAVALAQDGDRCRLSVADNGPGVSDEDRPSIAKRFARTDDARSTPGHGLGLNLVAAVCDLHGASLSFEDNRPGLRVIIDFNLVAAA